MVENTCVDLEIPLQISANDLVAALNQAYGLGFDRGNPGKSYLTAENPIAFLRGDQLLGDLGIRNGSDIYFLGR
jgi:hypothetical protein